MSRRQFESYVLVSVQFLCAVYFFYFALGTTLSVVSIVLLIAACALALWAIMAMQIGNFRIQPIPKDEAKLVTTGPYRILRHPIYAALLVAMFAISLSIGSVVAYGVWLLLAADLSIKLFFEETLLLEKFPEYKEYMKGTKRLLPFLW